jgi:hypothetical protein
VIVKKTYPSFSKASIPSKLRKLVISINEKYDVVECQEELLTKEHDKYVKLKKALAHEKEKFKHFTNEVKTYNDSISCLQYENKNLITNIEELNASHVSTSTVEHIIFCTRRRDIYVDAISDCLAFIRDQNDHIAKLDAKIAEHELENDKFNFARSMLYNGRRPDIEDGVGFQPGSQDNTKLKSHRNKISKFLKGKAPMVQDREGYILYPENYPEYKIRRIYARKSRYVVHHVYIYKNKASSSRHSISHAQTAKKPKKKIADASHEPKLSFKTFDASYVLTSKSGRVVAKYVGEDIRVQRLMSEYPR